MKLTTLFVAMAAIATAISIPADGGDVVGSRCDNCTNTFLNCVKGQDGPIIGRRRYCKDILCKKKKLACSICDICRAE